ncbi:MAG: hypothetical protein AB1714_06445 [Acidobacteriota bacterium]
MSLPLLLAAAAALLIGPCGMRAQSLAEVAKETKKAAQTQPAKRSFNNDDLLNVPEEGVDMTHKSGPRATVVVTSPVTAPAAPAPEVEPKSRGQDESYWRSRTSQFVKAKADAQARVDELQSQLNMLYPVMWATDDPARRAELMNQVDAKEKAIAAARQALAKANEDLDNLADEARRAGALPGWVRHD